MKRCHNPLGDTGISLRILQLRERALRSSVQLPPLAQKDDCLRDTVTCLVDAWHNLPLGPEAMEPGTPTF